MKYPTEWTLGLDPGFERSGLVLLRNKELIAWALHKLDKTACDVGWARAASLANGMLDSASRWVESFAIRELAVAIELPVYTRNPQTFLLQVRLLQELESGLSLWMQTCLDKLYITEVNPSTSKRLLAGNAKADKHAMIAASPWAALVGHMSHTDLHTLADSYAHALSAGRCEIDTDVVRFAPWTVHSDSETWEAKK